MPRVGQLCVRFMVCAESIFLSFYDIILNSQAESKIRVEIFYKIDLILLPSFIQ